MVRHRPGVEFPERRAPGMVHWGEERTIDLYSAGVKPLGSFDLPPGLRLVRAAPDRIPGIPAGRGRPDSLARVPATAHNSPMVLAGHGRFVRPWSEAVLVTLAPVTRH